MSDETQGRSAKEVARLDAVSRVYDPSNPAEEFDYHTKRLHVEVMGPWLRGRQVLEMGCATGELTSLLISLTSNYDVVEGSRRNIEIARQRVPTARFYESLWEDFTPPTKYTDIVLNCALEHVENPVSTLARAGGWLANDGVIHVVVPNADSLHRYVGVELGLLSSRTSLSESDLRIGHRRVYTIDTLSADLGKAGLSIVFWQGILLKVVSNRQMLEWDDRLIHALHVVGQRFPAHCAELYVVARRS